MHNKKYNEYIYLMTKNILCKKDYIKNFLSYKIYEPILMIFVLKLHVWCIINLDISLLNTDKDRFSKMINEFHLYVKDQIDKDKPKNALNVSKYFFFNKLIANNV